MGRGILHSFRPCGQDLALLLHGQEASPCPATWSRVWVHKRASYGSSTLLPTWSGALAWLREHEPPLHSQTTLFSPLVAATPGFKSQCRSSSISSFLTPPTLGYICQHSGFFCLSQLPLLVWASKVPWRRSCLQATLSGTASPSGYITHCIRS